jgi:hypothetical protein
VCCVLFDRGIILCDVCYLCVVSIVVPLPPGKNQFADKIITIIIIIIIPNPIRLQPIILPRFTGKCRMYKRKSFCET